MYQAHIDSTKRHDRTEVEHARGMRKVTLFIDANDTVSTFKNNDGDIVVNVRRATRNISMTVSAFSDLCDLKDTILMCCSFVDNAE